MAQHQPQPCRAFGHGGWPNGHGEQACGFQLLLQAEGGAVAAHHQGQDRTCAGGAGPACSFQAIAPALGTRQQGGCGGGVGLHLGKPRQGPCRQRGRQGRGVAKGPGALQQPFPHQPIARQKGSTATEGFAKGATDHGDAAAAMAQAPPPGSEYAQGMGFIQQQGRAMAAAELP